jgi:ABC-2 type transport system ATP-binding protein
MPEERGLYPKQPILDQLVYVAQLKGMGRVEARTQVRELLERFGLGERTKDHLEKLSLGNQQRVQIIASVLPRPAALILDEPFSGLDPVNVEFMIDVLSEFKKQDKTIIFSTHLMETAERLCHDILLINKSRKVVSGSLREVKQSYGKNLIALRATGVNGVLDDRSLVASVTSHADEQEIELAAGASSQALLRRLVDGGAVVSRFEQIEPSLNDIFIDQVGGAQ